MARSAKNPALTVRKIEQLRKQGLTWKEVDQKLGIAARSYYWHHHTRHQSKKEAKEEAPKDKQRRQVMRVLQSAAMHSPVDTRPHDRIRELEEEVASLRMRLAWSQRSSASALGGRFTLRASDHHYADANHLLSCGNAMQAKVLDLIDIYKPQEVQIVAGDDWIAGRGVYKEQDLDMVTSDVHEQLIVGAMKARRLLQQIRERLPEVPITWHIMRGNHDYHGSVSLTESLFYMMRSLNEDIESLKFQLHWDSMTVNLAYRGTYNVLVRHGFGYSKNSPNSPAFIDAVKDELLTKQRNMQPHEHYRRVLSGHTHFFSLSMERIVGLYFDTTGGLQRNTRVKLGANQRPVGWIVYVSPPDKESEILEPIGIQPDPDTYQREIADPHLGLANREDASREIKAYFELMEQRGDFVSTDHGQVAAGRW